jgi:protein SCO1/2
MARMTRPPGGSPRFALAGVAVAGMLILAAGAVIGFAFREAPHGAAGTVLANAIGGPFRLVDQHGKPFTDADLKGKWQLIYFGYTHCPDACPTALNDMALALDKLGAKRADVGIVFITVDPARDTPPVMANYVASFNAPIVALSGTETEVAQAAKDYRVYYAKHPEPDGDYAMDHSSVIYVMDPQGRFTASFTHENTPDEIADRLQKLLS